MSVVGGHGCPAPGRAFPCPSPIWRSRPIAGLASRGNGAPHHVRRGPRPRGARIARGHPRSRRARLGGAPGALRRLDRPLLARQRQVRRLRGGLRLLRPVALRRSRHADARDDGARSDPRAREGGRGGRRPPLLHGHPGPGPLQARLRAHRRRSQARIEGDQPQALRLHRAHLPRSRQDPRRRRASSASITTSSPRSRTTPRSRPPFATRGGSAPSTRSKRRASKAASAASSTWASRSASGSRWHSSCRRSTRPRCRSTS